MERRRFLALAPGAAMAAAGSPFLKGICGVIFPQQTPLAEQLRQARNAGFTGIEVRLGRGLELTATREEAERIAEQSRKAGVAIVSLWVSPALSETPLNHHDPAVRAKGVEAIHKAIDLARWVGCGALLIVPGRLGNGARFVYGYQDTWDRVTAELRKCVDHAAEARVYLTPENVWNKFLVSPIEMRSFVDQFQSPWVQTHFDIGNVMQFGYPQDWILTLGSRIRRVHVKDYKLSQRAGQGRFVDLLEGDVDWKDVMACFKKTGYRGFMCPEIGAQPNDPDHLKKVSLAFDRILELA
jgi:hexulose-6-phosphate isomerase